MESTSPLAALRPTDTALRLYEPVAAAQRALAEAAIVADSTGTTLSGSIRITASTVTAHYVLPPLLRDLRLEFPHIAIELVPSDTAENLLLREADIALRMFKPAQLDLVTRRFGDVPLGFYAAPRYLARFGAPTPSTLKQHRWVGFDRDETFLREARQLGFSFERGDFCFRSDSLLAQREAIRQGLGVGVLRVGHAVAHDDGLPLLPLQEQECGTAPGWKRAPQQVT